MPMSYACIYVPELSLTSKTREKLQGQLGISEVPNQTQCLANPTKILFRTIWNNPTYPTEEHCFETPATTCHFDFQKKRHSTRGLVSRVITGPSRFRHRFGKTWGFPKTQGFRVQTQGFCSKIMGCHG